MKVARTFFPPVIIRESKGTLFDSMTSKIALSSQSVSHKYNESDSNGTKPSSDIAIPGKG